MDTSVKELSNSRKLWDAVARKNKKPWLARQGLDTLFHVQKYTTPLIIVKRKFQKSSNHIIVFVAESDATPSRH
jgi:hypothetical protein